MQELLQKETSPRSLLDKLVASLNPNDQAATLSLLRRIFDNIIHYPNDEKYRQIKLVGKTFSSKVWQYPAGEELMKITGWTVDGDCVKLTDESLVHNMIELLNHFCALPSDQHNTVMNAAFSGDTTVLERMLNQSNVSVAGMIHFQDGSSIDLLKIAVATHGIDTIKLLVKTYSVDIYIPSMHIFVTILEETPESFAIKVLEVCRVKTSFASEYYGSTLLHLAVMFNRSKVVHVLVTNGVDVNATDKYMRTPLHYANLFDYKKIADYLSQNGADVRARDIKRCTPLEYIGGNSELIELSQYIQIKQRINMKPYSNERLYYLKLLSSGIKEESAVSLTVEQFPFLKEKEITETQDSNDHTTNKEEISRYISVTLRSTSQSSFLNAIACR